MDQSLVLFLVPEPFTEIILRGDNGEQDQEDGTQRPEGADDVAERIIPGRADDLRKAHISMTPWRVHGIISRRSRASRRTNRGRGRTSRSGSELRPAPETRS